MAEEQKPIQVDGKITPITKKEIQSVDSSQWNSLNLIQLYEQMSVLQQRLMLSSQMGNEALVKQIERGIKQLQEIIDSKGSNSGIF